MTSPFLSPAHTKSLIIPFSWQTSVPNGKNLLVGLINIETNLKDIDLTSFQQEILASSLFTNPNPTVDGFEQQMENTITSILNDFAPLKTGHRSGPRQTKNWLSPETVEAKKYRRRLERHWKTYNAEPDRLAYRAACRTTNELIMKSRAASNLERINSCSKNPKSLWTTIKSILHSSTPAEQLPPAVSTHWLTLWLLSSVRRLSLLNSPYPPNLGALHLLLLLTSPTLDRNSTTSHLSLQPR